MSGKKLLFVLAAAISAILLLSTGLVTSIVFLFRLPTHVIKQTGFLALYSPLLIAIFLVLFLGVVVSHVLKRF